RPPPLSTPFPYTTLFRSMEPLPFGYSSAGCIPAEPASASPKITSQPSSWRASLAALVLASEVRHGVAAGYVDCGSQHAHLSTEQDRKSTRLNSSHQIISY